MGSLPRYTNARIRLGLGELRIYDVVNPWKPPRPPRGSLRPPYIYLYIYRVTAALETRRPVPGNAHIPRPFLWPCKLPMLTTAGPCTIDRSLIVYAAVYCRMCGARIEKKNGSGSGIPPTLGLEKLLTTFGALPPVRSFLRLKLVCVVFTHLLLHLSFLLTRFIYTDSLDKPSFQPTEPDTKEPTPSRALKPPGFYFCAPLLTGAYQPNGKSANVSVICCNSPSRKQKRSTNAFVS